MMALIQAAVANALAGDSESPTPHWQVLLPMTAASNTTASAPHPPPDPAPLLQPAALLAAQLSAGVAAAGMQWRSPSAGVPHAAHKAGGVPQLPLSDGPELTFQRSQTSLEGVGRQDAGTSALKAAGARENDIHRAQPTLFAGNEIHRQSSRPSPLPEGIKPARAYSERSVRRAREEGGNELAGLEPPLRRACSQANQVSRRQAGGHGGSHHPHAVTTLTNGGSSSHGHGLPGTVTGTAASQPACQWDPAEMMPAAAGQPLAEPRLVSGELKVMGEGVWAEGKGPGPQLYEEARGNTRQPTQAATIAAAAAAADKRAFAFTLPLPYLQSLMQVRNPPLGQPTRGSTTPPHPDAGAPALVGGVTGRGGMGGRMRGAAGASQRAGPHRDLCMNAPLPMGMKHGRKKGIAEALEAHPREGVGATTGSHNGNAASSGHKHGEAPAVGWGPHAGPAAGTGGAVTTQTAAQVSKGSGSVPVGSLLRSSQSSGASGSRFHVGERVPGERSLAEEAVGVVAATGASVGDVGERAAPHAKEGVSHRGVMDTDVWGEEWAAERLGDGEGVAEGEEEKMGGGGSMGDKYLQAVMPKQKRKRILKERQRRDRIR